jgi:hypothetical protein
VRTAGSWLYWIKESAEKKHTRQLRSALASLREIQKLGI